MRSWQNARFPFREVSAMSEPCLRNFASDFILYKRSLGYSYQSAEWLMEKYVQFAEKNTTAPVPEKEITDDFLSLLSDAPGTLYQAVCLLREFSRYLQIRGYKDAYMIPPKTAFKPPAERPYFFTEKELTAFFEKIDAVQPDRSFKGREIVLPAMFRLLYCCGMRCREIKTLRCENVHTEEGFIDVLQSKGPKSRRLFISRELADYLKEYDERIRLSFPDREYFFPGRKGCCSSQFISGNFRRYWLKAFPNFEMTTRPRAYDLRHHFAWTNLNKWASEGLDLNVMLPYLMRYMGHQTVSETLYYFHFVPEFFPTYKEMTGCLDDMIPEVPYEE